MNDILDRINILLEAVEPSTADFAGALKVVEAQVKKFLGFTGTVSFHEDGKRGNTIWYEAALPMDKGYLSKCVSGYSVRCDLTHMPSRDRGEEPMFTFTIGLQWQSKGGGRNGLPCFTGWLDGATLKVIEIREAGR